MAGLVAVVSSGWLGHTADLMVVAAHPDDEYIFFGGAIPYYSKVQHRSVETVFMTSGDWGSMDTNGNLFPNNDNRKHRMDEAVRAARISGTSCVFLGLPDILTTNENLTLDMWGKGKAVALLAHQIVVCKPKVVITHDYDGEYGHGNHKATARIVDSAVSLAATNGWQVQKVYHHLGNSNTLVLTQFETYFPTIHSTPREIAQMALGVYTTDGPHFVVSESAPHAGFWVGYTHLKWSLTFSTVGYSTNLHDFFEGIK